MNLSFKRFMTLLEGGNLEVELNGQKYSAERLGLDKITRDKLQNLIYGIIKDINEKFKAEYQMPLWQDLNSLIKGKPLIISGSGNLALSPEEIVSWEELKDKKGSLGDIDIQYPKEHDDLLGDLLTSLKGKKVGNGTFVNLGGNSKTQYNCLVEIPENIGIGDEAREKTYIQFDFEPVKFEQGAPSKLARYQFGSDWEDVKLGIKGAYTKHLAQAVLRTKVNFKSDDIMVFTYSEKTGKAKLSSDKKWKEDPVGLFASSPKGIRAKLRPILMSDAKLVGIDGSPAKVKDEESGKIVDGVKVDGKTAFWALESSDDKATKYTKSKFIENFDLLTKMVTDKTDTDTMMSVVKMMKAVASSPIFKDDKSRVSELYGNFLPFVWGLPPFYKDRKLLQKDIKEKDAVMSAFFKAFNIKEGDDIMAKDKAARDAYIKKYMPEEGV